MKVRLVSSILLCLALAGLGCSGEDGERGPAGPAGTANVIYSDWYAPATWVAGTAFGIAERSYTMTTSLLTQEIIDNGVIIVYMRFVGLNPEVNQLPILLADVHLSFFIRAQAGSIKVVYYNVNTPGTDPGGIPSENLVRYVLIPGGVLADVALSEGVTREELAGSLRAMPYAEMCRVFDIAE